MKFEIGAALLHPATNRYMTTYLKTLSKSCNASIAYSEDFLLDKLAEYIIDWYEIIVSDGKMNGN